MQKEDLKLQSAFYSRLNVRTLFTLKQLFCYLHYITFKTCKLHFLYYEKAERLKLLYSIFNFFKGIYKILNLVVQNVVLPTGLMM